jgi:putative PIN family toxin of toxin-antitoxin system
LKAVFDTNVFIAAFVASGICAKLLLRARRGQFQLIGSTYLFKEFERVLIRKFSVARNEARDASRLIAEATHVIVDPAETVTGICRDPDDDYLITGDADLLALKNFEETQILSPRNFELLFID